MKLILASASSRRAEILRDAGVPFSVLSSAVDETPLPGETASELVRRLAAAKAELVAARAVGPDPEVHVATLETILAHCAGHPTVYLPSHDPESAARLRDSAVVNHSA